MKKTNTKVSVAILLGGLGAAGSSNSLYLMFTTYLTRERMWHIGLFVYSFYLILVLIFLFSSWLISRPLNLKIKRIIFSFLCLSSILVFIYNFYFYDKRLYWWLECGRFYYECMTGS